MRWTPWLGGATEFDWRSLRLRLDVGNPVSSAFADEDQDIVSLTPYCPPSFAMLNQIRRDRQRNTGYAKRLRTRGCLRERINFSQSIAELAPGVAATGTTTGGHRSNAIRARLVRMPSSSSIRRDGMSRRSFPSPTTSRSCRCRQNHPSSIQWKISRNSCATTGFPTASSNPTTTFSTTAVRLEQA